MGAADEDPGPADRAEGMGRRFDPRGRLDGDPWVGDGVAGRSGEGFAPHDVIATLSDMGRAREAVQALQLAGIDAAQISLFGPAADEAVADLDVREADAAFTDVMWRRTWIGGLVGAAIGALVGAVGGGAVLWASLPEASAVLWAAIVGTAVLGLGTGAATGGTSSAQMSRAWELTFHRVGDGEVGVAVHTERPEEAVTAERILARHDPSQLERFDLGAG